MNVNHSASSGDIIGISFRFYLKGLYVVNRLIEAFLISSHKIPFFNLKINDPKLSQIYSYWIFSKGLKNEFETAVVNESSVFESLTVYCI